MLIPEVVIFRLLTGIIKTVTDDYASQSDKDKSILGLLFKTDDDGKEISINNWIFFDQAVGVFIRNANNPRKLSINIGYNMERMGPPTLHIITTQDTPGSFTGTGVGEGYVQESFDPITGESSQTHTVSYRADFNIMITSDNSSEVLLIYHLLKGMLGSLEQNVELMGLRLLETSGADVQFDDRLAPPNIFHRYLTISCQYESSYKTLFEGNDISKIIPKVCDDFYLDNIENKDIPGVTRA